VQSWLVLLASSPVSKNAAWRLESSLKVEGRVDGGGQCGFLGREQVPDRGGDRRDGDLRSLRDDHFPDKDQDGACLVQVRDVDGPH
jgi:hypothetical protein